MKIFSIENPVMRIVVKIVDCIYLSVMWLIFSLPVVTIGASSAAMYTTVYKYIRRDEGHLFRTFWDAFKGNFKRSTPVWLIALAVQVILVVDAWVFRGMLIRGEFLGRLYWFLLVLCCVSIAWVTYMTAYAARFTGTVKDILKFGIILLLMHPLCSFGIVATVLASAALIIIAPGFLAVLPAVSGLICSIIMEKVFLRHMSEEDIKKTVGEEDPV